MRWGIVQFPGSNCDRDMEYVLGREMGFTVQRLWHEDDSLPTLDAIAIPGGFSYGDYLRSGALARFSTIMPAIREFSEQGGIVLGICNGFQILTESGLLPGVLAGNINRKFICRILPVNIPENLHPRWKPFEGKKFRLPVAHAEGRYVADENTLKLLNDSGRIILRYDAENPNGSMNQIAGICNEKGNVAGMMPHPERSWFYQRDGLEWMQIFCESQMSHA